MAAFLRKTGCVAAGRVRQHKAGLTLSLTHQLTLKLLMTDRYWQKFITTWGLQGLQTQQPLVYGIASAMLILTMHGWPYRHGPRHALSSMYIIGCRGMPGGCCVRLTWNMSSERVTVVLMMMNSTYISAIATMLAPEL
jgi:hypothetical protein